MFLLLVSCLNNDLNFPIIQKLLDDSGRTSRKNGFDAKQLEIAKMTERFHQYEEEKNSKLLDQRQG